MKHSRMFSVSCKLLLASGFILLIGIMFAPTIARGQQKDKLISLKLDGESVLDAIQKINRQSGNSISYKKEELEKESKRVTVNLKDAKVLAAVETVLKETRLVAIVHGDVILIVPRQMNTGTVKSITLKGFVTDQNKDPMPGVTVKLVGVSLGTATNARGYFSIELPIQQGTLEFTFVGFKNKRVAFSEKTDTLRVVLEEDVKAIEEVVVTGYQAIKEKAMAGSYSKVKAEELVMTGNETIESMLQGKVPGMVVINQSGLTGTRQKVRVRGTSTLVGNAEPVWVVDGIIQEDNLPFETSELGAIGDSNLDMMKDFIGGAVSWLNPNDIEDITVLKDASATAIYGVKAANGVILITTKRGERGSMSVNYSGSFSTSQKMNYKRQDVMNSKERVDLSREAFSRGARVGKETVGYSALAYAYLERKISWEEFNTGVKKLEATNTDWFDILYRTPFSQSHSLSFSGGNDDATYRASFGYSNVKNTAKGNEQETYTGSLNTSFIFWKKLTVTAGLSGSHVKTQAFAAGVDPFNYAINTSRVIGCFDEEGELFYYTKGKYKYNIINELSNSNNENTTKSLKLNLSARWRFSENFTLAATLGGSTSSYFAESWFTERSHKIASVRGYEFGEYGATTTEFQNSFLPYGGMLTTSESRNFSYTARVQFEYVQLLKGVHSVNLMAGIESRSNEYDGYSQTNWGYMPDRGKTFTDVPLETPAGKLNTMYARTKPIITDKVSNYVSYYATASYMYDNRYSINLSVRGDGSNTFGKTAKFQPVWSAGLRWNVTDEHWMADQKFVNTLAFVASLGYQGNVAENISPDFIAKVLAVDSKTGEYQMTWKSLPNPDLKWEKTFTVNLGANFSILGNKLNGTFNWYYKKTVDVITSAKVPYETGTTSMYVNDGEVSNQGWDLSFTVIPIRTKDFMWSLGTSFSGNSNNVKSEVEKNGTWKHATDGSIAKAGYPVGSFWAFKFTGLDPENGGPLFDLSRANTSKAAEDATEYMIYMGTREPTFTVGINMVFRWKRFSFPLNFYISRGNYEFLDSPYENGYEMLSEFKNASNELNDRWREPGDETRTNIPSIPVGKNCQPLYPFENGVALYPLDAWQYSDVRVVNAWYIRFNDFRFSYNLPDKWIKGFAKSVALSCTVTNPLQIKSKDFKGRDPEVALGSQPRSQNFSFGINVSF